MANSIAILVGAAIIAGAILFVFRWDDSAARGADGNPTVFRLDRWTGKVAICGIDVQKSLAAYAADLECKAP
jgi:hypothetical protein